MRIAMEPVVSKSPAPKPKIKAAPRPSAPRRPVVSAPRASYTASRSVKAPAASKPTGPPSIASYLLGDTTYQDQQAQLQRAYAEFMAQQNLDKTNYDTTYAQQLRDLGKARDQGYENLQDDYASRGLLKSGLYADAYSDLQDQYNTRQSDIDAAKAQYLAGLAQAATTFKNDQNTTLTSAKQEAIARRAAKYNLGVA